MSFRNLTTLRTVCLIALCLALAAFGTVADVLAKGPQAGSNPGDTGLRQGPRFYPRANYVWPYATGPVYGDEVTARDIAQPGVIQTRVGTFRLDGGFRSLPSALKQDLAFDTPDAARHFLVFALGDRDQQVALAQAINASGGQVLIQDIGRGTLTVRLTAAGLDRLRSNNDVVAVEPVHPALKLDPDIGRAPLMSPIDALSETYTLHVRLWPGVDSTAVAAQVVALGGDVHRVADEFLRVDLHRSKLTALARLEAVRWISEVQLAVRDGEETTTTMQTGNYNLGDLPYHAVFIDGGGNGIATEQRITVIDDGVSVDAGDMSDTSMDAGAPGAAHRKVYSYRSAGDFGGLGDFLSCDDEIASGGVTHGQAVASVALGNASDVDTMTYGTPYFAEDPNQPQLGQWKIDGVAPKAKLIIHDSFRTPGAGDTCDEPDAGGLTVGDPWLPGTPLASHLGSAYADGSRIMNMSFSFPASAIYDTFAEAVDDFLIANPDAMVFTSAGNTGQDTNTDGIPDFPASQVKSPGSAKNLVVVGATFNANSGTGDFPDTRAAFSSVGPAVSTAVNRMVPHIMAPGVDVAVGTAGSLGLRSDYYCRSSDNDQDSPTECNAVQGFSGTSFASPAAAGAAALVRDYFAQGYYPTGAQVNLDAVSTISGALLKAVLFASGDYLDGGNLSNRFGQHRFNHEQGYGRVQLDKALPLQSWPGVSAAAQNPTGMIVHDFIGGALNVSDFTGLSNFAPADNGPGDAQATTFTVCDDEQELRVSLVWTDPKDTDMPNPTGRLQNNLDLTLLSPSGIEYRGNYFTDDNDLDGTTVAGEDCPKIGEYTANGLTDKGPFSLPVCANSKIPGQNQVLNAFDDANNAEVIVLSHNADRVLSDPNDPNSAPLIDGTCQGTPGNPSGVGGGACYNNLDCAFDPSAPVPCTGGGTAGDCCVGGDRQTEFGTWTAVITPSAAVGGGGITGTQDYSLVVTGGVCLGSSVKFTKGVYACNEDVTVQVNELSLLSTTTISTRTTVEVIDENDNVVDVEDGLSFVQPNLGAAKYQSVPVQLTDGTARDPYSGALDIRDGDTLRVTYADPAGDRVSQAKLSCSVDLRGSTTFFVVFGQDSAFAVAGGCERNARNQFEFGFPDNYMDADELLQVLFAFSTNETVDLSEVSAGLRCVLVDTDSPASCQPDGTGCDTVECQGPCDPTRETNAVCPFMEILNSPQSLGTLPQGQAQGATFDVKMAPDAAFTPDPTPTVELILAVSARTAGKTADGLLIRRQKLNVDEASTLYSTDFPTGGTQILDWVNNEEVDDPNTDFAGFQGMDYRFDTRSYGNLTVGKDAGGSTVARNQNLRSPWNFDGNDGGFLHGLGQTSSPPSAVVNQPANWGEDENFNNVEDGVCDGDKSRGCWKFGIPADARCADLSPKSCSSTEFNGPTGSFNKNRNTLGGCGWQTRATKTCSTSLGLRGCIVDADCAGVCVNTGSSNSSTFEACTGATCPTILQCSDSLAAPNVYLRRTVCGSCSGGANDGAQCRINADCDSNSCLADDTRCGGVGGACGANGAQTCTGFQGTCTGAAPPGGGVWHTGIIGSLASGCGGGAGSQCEEYLALKGTNGEDSWWELLATPVIEKVNQEEDADGEPVAQAEIMDWAWNMSEDLPDNTVAMTWEFDTDTASLLPVSLFIDGSVLNTGAGPFGPVEGTDTNPALQNGFGLFAAVSRCDFDLDDNQVGDGTGSFNPCVVTRNPGPADATECPRGECSGNTAIKCHFDIDCGANGPCGDGAAGGILDPELCFLFNDTVNGGGAGSGNNRVGQNSCLFDGTIAVVATPDIGLAKPPDDDLNQDGDGSTDEYVEANGPKRNFDLVDQPWNGPDFRVFTLEDLYGDTGNAFQGAVGFVNFESGTATVGQDGFGVAIDDMVVEWREFTLEQDTTDCANGLCATIIANLGINAYDANQEIAVSVLEPNPDADNDCNLDGTPDGTTNCDGDAGPTRDIVVLATSEAETTGEIIFLNQCDGTATRGPGCPDGVSIPEEFRGTIVISQLGNSPGILFVSQAGQANPTVTLTYKDNDDGTGNACPNDVDPSKHGVVQTTVTVILSSTCDIDIIGSQVDDNDAGLASPCIDGTDNSGDGDNFADTHETVCMSVKMVNNCGIDLNNCTARISTSSPEVECITHGLISIPQIPFDPNGASFTPADWFIWKASALDQTNPANPSNWKFTVTVVCDEIDGTSSPQSVAGPFDLNITYNPNDLTVWNENFDAGPTLASSKFVANNDDDGIPGNSDAEGLVNGDGWRCQYSDPDWSNSNSYNTGEAPTCYPGFDLAQSQAVFWQIDSGLDAPTGSGKGFQGTQSLYYGLWKAANSQYTTPISTIESVQTSAPINLGPDNPVLSFWQQVSLVDSRGIGNAGPGRNGDRGVVQVQLADKDTGVAVGDWVNLQAFQNSYDTQAGDFYFNCFFDPVDDGNQEDDFFDPTDPNRGINGTLGGPSSTCYPEFAYSCIGDTTMVTSGDTTTDLPFSLANACNADTVNASTVQAGANPIRAAMPITTWVQSKYDMTGYRGRRLRLRYIVGTIKISNPDWRAQFGANVGARDDGWWIDAINVDQTLINAATFVVDPAPNTGLQGCGSNCTTVTANLVTAPGGTNPPSVTLDAPGQVIEFNAATSFADACLSGSLQYRYLKDGIQVRGWAAAPTFLAAPDGPATYSVEVRCSTALGCVGSKAVFVDVGCPASGRLRRFPEIFGSKSGSTATFSWTPFLSGGPLSWEAVYGDLSVVGSFLTSSLVTDTDTDFSDTDGALPALSPGEGRYYIAGRHDASECNETPANWDGCDATDSVGPDYCGQALGIPFASILPAGSRNGKGTLPTLP